MGQSLQRRKPGRGRASLFQDILEDLLRGLHLEDFFKIVYTVKVIVV